MATDMARRCMEALDRNGQDITMLWLLKDVEWLEQCKAGRELTDWVRNRMEVPTKIASGEEFQAEVLREFKSRGGVRPVAPERVVDHWSKTPAKQLCLDAKWPKPFFPVMLQLNPRKPGGPGGDSRKLPGAFVIFSCWQDAMLALRDMAIKRKFQGKDRWYAVEMVYENQIVDMGAEEGTGYDYPCRLILDCDAKISEHGEGHTLESLKELIQQVPAWFVRRLVEIGAIKSTDRVVVFEKEKSRDNKASRHYIFNIMGYSTWDTKAVFDEIFAKEHEKEKELLAKKGVQKSVALPAWKMVDTVPHHGRGQYSVLGFFDKDKKETEYPCTTRRLEIVDGKIVSIRSSKLTRDRSNMDCPTALAMLQEACYSCFVPEFVTMHSKYMVQHSVRYDSFKPAVRVELTRAHPWQAKKKGSSTRGAGPRANAPHGPGDKRGFLPQWAQSAISRITGRGGGYDVNTSMPCLDKVYSFLSDQVQDIRREDVARLSPALFCPTLACKGVCKVHENNGTFVAVNPKGDVLYARCADSTCHCDEEEMKQGCMDVICGGTRPWIKLTAEKMAEFEGKTQSLQVMMCRKRQRRETLIDGIEEGDT